MDLFLPGPGPLLEQTTWEYAAAAVTDTTTLVPLDPASAVSDATLALTAPTTIPLQASSAQSSATLALTAQTTVPLQASSASQRDSRPPSTHPGPARPGFRAVLGDIGAHRADEGRPPSFIGGFKRDAERHGRSGSRSARSRQRRLLGTLALSAQTQVPLQASSGQSSATLALSAQTTVPLQASSAVCTPSLSLTAPTKVPLDPASATASATLALTAPTKVALGTSSAQSSAAWP
jgi:hypothetical protein